MKGSKRRLRDIVDVRSRSPYDETSVRELSKKICSPYTVSIYCYSSYLDVSWSLFKYIVKKSKKKEWRLTNRGTLPCFLYSAKKSLL